jgi:hypothetical protein
VAPPLCHLRRLTRRPRGRQRPLSARGQRGNPHHGRHQSRPLFFVLLILLLLLLISFLLLLRWLLLFVVGEALDLERRGNLEEHVQLAVFNAHLAVVDKFKDGVKVLKMGAKTESNGKPPLTMRRQSTEAPLL